MADHPDTANRTAASSLPPVLLKGEIEIYPDQRLPHLDQGPIQAFAASGRQREKSFALICEKSLVPQIHMASKFATINHPHLARLVGAGVVQWSPAKQQRHVFVYENKMGMPIATEANALAMGLKGDNVLNGVVKKLAPILKTFREMDLVFGNFRTRNLYTGGGSGFEKLVLGECLSTPLGFLYSAVYEPIERAAALPIGRGAPDYADDLYSFGAMLAVMIRTVDPLAGHSDDDIIAYKVEHGSYQALIGRERVSGSILELLRGLLVDDVRQRWSIDDILNWLDGQRVQHKQAGPLKPKGARPMDFFGEKYLRPQSLALALNKNPTDVVRMADNGDLRLWLNRSVQDKKLEETVENAIISARENGAGGEAFPHRLAAYIAIALSPDIPISYRHVRFLPDGFGRVLAENFANNRDLNVAAEIIQLGVVNFWASRADYLRPDAIENINRFDTCRLYLRQTSIGYGLERCLYYLCPEAPCMSEKLKDFYVRTPEDYLAAFEQIALGSAKPESLFDRHIIAFLSVKDKAVIEPYLPDLNAAEPGRKLQATLRIVLAIQKRGKMSALPGLTAWLSDRMDPLINLYHDREQRAALKAMLTKAKEKGDISRIAGIVDNPQALQADVAGFRNAAINHHALKAEFSRLDHELRNNPQYGAGAGHQAAALIAGLVAALIVMGYLFIKFSTRMPF